MDKYEALEGKRVKCYHAEDDWKWGIVVNIDPNIGITIVQESNHKINLLCLIGPLSLLWKDYFDPEMETFNTLCKQIEEGSIGSHKVDGDQHLNGISHLNGVPHEFCPFNQ